MVRILLPKIQSWPSHFHLTVWITLTPTIRQTQSPPCMLRSTVHTTMHMHPSLIQTALPRSNGRRVVFYLQPPVNARETVALLPFSSTPRSRLLQSKVWRSSTEQEESMVGGRLTHTEARARLAMTT
jgi:hypothetical protein